MIRSLLEPFRQRLEDWGWWYGKLKPCDCSRDDRYWGLATHPPDCERVNDGAEKHVTETDAATVVEWKRTITWRCRQCGDEFTQKTGVTIERQVYWNEDPNESNDSVRGRHT